MSDQAHDVLDWMTELERGYRPITAQTMLPLNPVVLLAKHHLLQHEIHKQNLKLWFLESALAFKRANRQTP